MTNITVNSNLCNLTRLRLEGNELIKRSYQHLLQSCPLKLTDLDLAFLPIGDETLQSILSNPQYSKITRLEMRYNTNITTKSIPIIVDTLTMLRDFYLEWKLLGTEDCRYIAESPCFRNMTRLSLEYCDIGPEGVKVISSNKSKLKHLSLVGNEIGDEGCHFIATSPNMIHLETLDLDYNRISREGCKSLANSPFLPRLSSLHVEGNYRSCIEILELHHHFGENCKIDSEYFKEDDYDSSDEEERTESDKE